MGDVMKTKVVMVGKEPDESLSPDELREGYKRFEKNYISSLLLSLREKEKTGRQYREKKNK